MHASAALATIEGQETNLAYHDLRDWIAQLDRAGELRRIREEVDPILEIAEITDRVSKSGREGVAGYLPGGPALLFERVKGYPGASVLMNQFGSRRRMEMALEATSLDEIAGRIQALMEMKSPEGMLGKPVASDLREGKATMAVIHALERCTPEERAKIETILRDRAFNGVTHAQIMEILNRYRSLEAATSRATRYAESAQKAICTFPDSEIKRALLWAPEFVVAREK